MNQIFGDFREDLPEEQEFLLIGFSPSSLPIQQRWRNNGLSADFAADYLTTFFPASSDNPSARRRQAEIKSAVSYIANELLENAMKFNHDASRYPIKFGMHLLDQTDVTVVLYTLNSISPQALSQFQGFIQELLASDPDELYLSKLEKSAEAEQDDLSQLGLLTMINDYAARLGWKFDTVNSDPQTIRVTTMVQLTV